MKYQNPLPLDTSQQAHLDAWADIYFKAHIVELLAIPLSKFLTAPTRYLAQAGQETALTANANDYRPLLPAQVAASQRIQKQWQDQDNAVPAEKSALQALATHS
ncbi:MAG: hypothetical protein A2Y50_08710 [Pseudomonadales bacterium RIFCSPLOWO2_12_59_9]|nr:MAG: hypothetical protein A2Y50_08710 [Pseudomonadales bacterium RIFCSPLOWO2_12_59_9]